MVDLFPMLQSFVMRHLWPVVAILVVVGMAARLPLSGLEMALWVMGPVVAGMLGAVGMMGLLGLPAGLINSVFMVPVVGLAIGYSLFLLAAELALFRGRPRRPATTGGTVVVCIVTAALAVGSLALARYSMPHSLVLAASWVLGFGMVASMVLVPAGARLFLRRSHCGGIPRLYHLMGGLWCLLYLLVIHFILLAIALPIATLIHPRDRSRRGRGLRRLARPGLAGLVHSFPYGRVVCRGVTRDAFAKPSIIISNHQSIVDIPLLSRVPCDLRLTIKGQWWMHPLIGAGVKALNHIRVDAGDPESVMRQGAQAFREGSSIHFFPQGTRSRCDAPLRFHKGAFELAIHLNAEIQPVVLCDTWTCLPRGGIWVENFRMRMRILPRITPATFDYTLGARALAKHAQDSLYEAWLEELEQNNVPAILRRKVERLYRYQGLKPEGEVFARLRNDPELGKLHGWVPREGLILDLGCGYGAISHWLAQAGPERKLLGVDRDPDRIQVARCAAHDSQQMTFETHDVRAWPLPECRAILLLDAMDGFSAAEETALLEKVFQALSGGGRLILRGGASPDDSGTEAVAADYGLKLRNLGFAAVEKVGRTFVAIK